MFLNYLLLIGLIVITIMSQTEYLATRQTESLAVRVEEPDEA